MQLLPEAPMQCCLVLPSIACTNTSTDTVDIVSPYSGLVDTMNNDTMTLVCSNCPGTLPSLPYNTSYTISSGIDIFMLGRGLPGKDSVASIA